MARRRWQPKINASSEFELDLAPLLAVMVKLVPVLLLSSAFVQIMVIETDLPQVVKDAMVQENTNPEAKVAVQLQASATTGFQIIVEAPQAAQWVETIPLKDKNFDYSQLHQTLVKIKSKYPQTFKIEFAPDAGVAYKDIVRMMDESRKSRDNKIAFPVFDKKTNKESSTDYMFPEVVFANVMEG